MYSIIKSVVKTKRKGKATILSVVKNLLEFYYTLYNIL
ncbi:hypothetical protein QEW_2243 [Clostridioides difficile CD160]|nr:hypothetical protein QEW_2243 [Clostridioides difficile CD160]